ncbi:MAG: hypothetical protein U9N79_00030 [Actinomycetota bacterium]|nr:hypothetical protein [Actinomycetota bacterium]
MTSKTKMVVGLIAVMALFVAACGSASDLVTENLAEELIEASSDEDVDIDISGDGDDMTINIETEEGSMSMGAGASMPEDLEIPVPDDGDVISSFTADGVISVSLSYGQGSFDEIVGYYENWTDGTGEEWESSTLSLDTGEGMQRTNMWVQNETSSMVTVSDCPAVGSSSKDLNAVCVSIIQGE